MAYNRKPNYHFKTKNDVGIHKVPNNRVIVVEDYDGESLMFIKKSNTGLTASSTIADAVAAGVVNESSSSIDDSLTDADKTWSSEKIVTDYYDKTSLDDGQLDNRYYTETEVDSALSLKQETLVSGTNIKTLNGQDLTGGGDVTVSSGTKLLFEKGLFGGL